jgi:hypothetical protein
VKSTRDIDFTPGTSPAFGRPCRNVANGLSDQLEFVTLAWPRVSTFGGDAVRRNGQVRQFGVSGQVAGGPSRSMIGRNPVAAAVLYMTPSFTVKVYCTP